MGFFSKLFGRKEPLLERDAFGEEMATLVTALGDNLKAIYDREQFCLRIDDRGGPEGAEHYSFLSNSYRDYTQVDASERTGVMKRYAAAAAARLERFDGDFGNVASRLVPLVRNRCLANSAMLRLMRITDGPVASTADLAGVPLGGPLSLGLAIDYPDRIAHCTQSQLDDWGVSLDAALRLARANLRNLSDEGFAEVASGIYMSPWSDTYDASRLACPEMFRRLDLRGDPVALSPTRICTFVVGSDDGDAQRAALSLAIEAQSADRPLSMVPLRLAHDNTWHEYFPEREHGIDLYRSYRVMEHADACAQQKEMLELRFERDGIDLFVASFIAAGRERDDGGPPEIVMTRATWTEGVSTWLPSCEQLLVLLLDERLMAIVPFDAALAAWPHLLSPVADTFPQRYATSGFPTRAEVEGLGGEFLPLD